MPQHQGPKSDEYEKIIRFVKKIANTDNERDNRFRNMDKLRDYVRKDRDTRHQTAINSKTIFNLLIRCMFESSRKVAKEAGELIADIIGVIYETDETQKRVITFFLSLG